MEHQSKAPMLALRYPALSQGLPIKSAFDIHGTSNCHRLLYTSLEYQSALIIMTSGSPGAEFSTGDRIKQLNDIDRDVVQLLHSAGLAVKALTKPSLDIQDGTEAQQMSNEQQRENFTSSASRYFSLLSSVDVRLRRQIYALEEAEILPAEVALKEHQTSLAVPSAFAGLGNTQTASLAKQAALSKVTTSGGGLGSLDVGWLNSRNDNVGKEMEAELWAKAEEFVMAQEENKANEDKDTIH